MAKKKGKAKKRASAKAKRPVVKARKKAGPAKKIPSKAKRSVKKASKKAIKKASKKAKTSPVRTAKKSVKKSAPKKTSQPKVAAPDFTPVADMTPEPVNTAHHDEPHKESDVETEA